MTPASRAANPAARKQDASAPPDRAETRERIIRVATAQFKAAGYEGTTMSAIARASGVTTPALYWHFRSKEEIAFASIERVYDEMYEALLAANHGSSAADRLRSVVGVWVRTVLGDPELQTGLNSHQLLAALSDEHREVLRRKDREFEQLMLAILSDGATEGLFEINDPVITTGVIITACDYAFVWLQSGRKRSVDYIAERFGELMVAMVSHSASGRSK